MSRRRTSHSWQVVLAFFLGAAVSSIAYDGSDYAFYSASASGQLSAAAQPFWFAVFPLLFYGGFFVASYMLAKRGLVKPVFILYFYLFTIILAGGLGLQLPQASDPFYTNVLLLGLFVSGGIILGLIRQVKRGR